MLQPYIKIFPKGIGKHSGWGVYYGSSNKPLKIKYFKNELDASLFVAKKQKEYGRNVHLDEVGIDVGYNLRKQQTNMQNQRRNKLFGVSSKRLF